MKLSYHSSALVCGLAFLVGIWTVACGGDNDNSINGSGGGAKPNTGGTTNVNSSAGGANAKTGGASTAAGGTVISTGGTAAATGGASTATGGTAAATGGVSSAAGGTVAATGGTSTAAGGASTTTGGNSATGGRQSTGGSIATGGSVATGGTPAAGGSSAAIGGALGTGGSGGTNCATLYDFEGNTGTQNDVQEWAADRDIALTTTTTAFVTGGQSLQVTLPAIAEGTSKSLTVNPPAAANLWPGTVVTFHAMIPQGATGVWIQAFSQSNNWINFDTLGNSAVTVTPGAWTTWTYTIPNTFPGGLQAMGVQIGVDTGGVFDGGDVFIDSITACAGAAVCAGSGSASYSWETAGSVEGWVIGGNPSAADTVIAQSTDLHIAGSGSLKVTFTGLPASAARQIYIDNPNAYCGQVVTYNVYVPIDFGAGIKLQPFSSANGSVWDAGASVTPTPGAWNTFTYTLPQIGPLGLQQLGLQIYSSASATAYTGSIYLDAVSWGAAVAQ